MSVISTSGIPELQEYMQPVAVTSDSGKPNEKNKKSLYIWCYLAFDVGLCTVLCLILYWKLK